MDELAKNEQKYYITKDVECVFDVTDHIWLNCRNCSDEKNKKMYETCIKNNEIILKCQCCGTSGNYKKLSTNLPNSDICNRFNDTSIFIFKKRNGMKIEVCISDEEICFIHETCGSPCLIKLDKVINNTDSTKNYINLKCENCKGHKKWKRYRKIMGIQIKKIEI